MALVARKSNADLVPVERDSTRLEDAGMAAVSVWIVTAVYLDGRAHFLELPDSFFTWWHLLMYSGVIVATLLLLAMGLRRRKPEQSVVGAALDPPRGYGYSVVGAGLFLLGGLGDMLWHSVFGVEAGLDALLSPTHLVLMSGALLLFMGPLIATIVKDPEADVWALSALVATGAMTAVVGFALSYISAFNTDAPLRPVLSYPEGTPQHYAAEVPAVAGLASFVVTTLVLIVPLVFLVARRQVPLGTATLGVTAVAVLAAILNNVERPWIMVGAFIGGLVVDVVIAVGSRRASRRAVAIIVAVTLPVAVWSAVLIALQLADGVQWSPELAAGSVLLSALVSLVVALAAGWTGQRSVIR